MKSSAGHNKSSYLLRCELYVCLPENQTAWQAVRILLTTSYHGYSLQTKQGHAHGQQL